MSSSLKITRPYLFRLLFVLSANFIRKKFFVRKNVFYKNNSFFFKNLEVLDQLSFINQQQQRVSYLTIQNLLVGNISNFSLYTNYDSILLLFCQLLV